MQSSIWKLVTAVGIIGIGTLVVLEVQHRLPQQKVVPVGLSDGDQPSVEIGSPTQENDFVPAADSEFDRMFANASDGSGLSEPPVSANADHQDVSTVVRRNELASEPSPFAFEEPVAEPSGSNESSTLPVEPNRVTPVAFQKNPQESNSDSIGRTTGNDGSAVGTPTLSFETPSNPFPQETPAAESPESPELPMLDAGNAAAPGGSAASAPRSATENSLMFFPGQSDGERADEGSGPGTTNEGAAPLTAEETKSAFPSDGAAAAPAARSAAPAARSAAPVATPPVSAQSGDSEIPDFNFGEVNEPPSENPFSASPFFDEDDKSTPAPVNPSRNPIAPVADEPAPFERDDRTPEPEPSPFEEDATRGSGGVNAPSQPERSTRPSRPEIGSLASDVPAFDREPALEPTPSVGDETFDGGALPFVPDNDDNNNSSDTDSAPRLPERSPGGAGDETSSGADFPPLPGIEVPGPRNPRTPSVPGSAPEIDPFPPGDSPVTAEAQILRPHLTVEKKAPETASVGIPLDYTIVVSNEGESAAADVIVEDELSRGVDLQTTSPTADYDERSRLMTWRIAELGPRESREIRVRVIPTGEGTLNGVATVRFKAQVKASTLITAPKLSIELTCPQEVRAGDQVEMKYVVRNNGSGDARSVLLRSVLPENLRHPEGNDLEYEIELLRAGEEQEVTLTVVAAERGECLASAELSTTGIQPVTTEARVNVIGELLKVERLGPERRYVGRASQFQNIITNITNFEATNVVVMELVPEGMKFVSASEAGEYNPADRLITWRIARIEPNKQVLLDVELTPEHAGSMDSIVQVVESAGFKSQAVKTVAVEDLHNIGADVSQIKGPVAVGEKFTFAITIDNRGTANATNVQLTVQLPKQLKVLAAGSKEQGIEGRPAPGNAVTFKAIQEVPPNSSKTFQLVLQGQEPVRNGVIKAELSYREMTESLVVSESVTVFSDAP